MLCFLVAPATVIITRENDGMVELFSQQTLVCDVEIIDEVDVPIIVEIDWDLPIFFTNVNKVSISHISGSGSVYYGSTLTVDNFTLEDSGNYSCTASVTPVVDGSGSIGVSDKTVSSTNKTHLRAGKGL